jgi:uncharacterized sulfatase
MTRTSGLCLTLICLFVATNTIRAVDAATPTPPNVVLIISDDQAWTDYGFMGHPAIKTPNLDRLASQSLTFKRGYVPSSLCCPSLASLITGMYPHQHKVTCNDPIATTQEGRNEPAYAAGREVLNKFMDAAPALPRDLGARGYLSLQTGKWWQGDYTRGGFTHGMTKGQRHGDEGLAIGRKTMQPIYDFIDDAQTKGKPFLVWYAPMMPHLAHNPPKRILKKYLDKTPSERVARYWAMCEWFDETCGQLLEHLEQKKLADNTIVVFLADNGYIQDTEKEEYAPRSKQSPNEGGIRTPIMIRWPGHVKPRMSEDDLAISVDLAPTLLHACGVEPPKQMSGINLLDENAVKNRHTIFGECFTHTAVDLDHPAASLRWRWVIDGNFKLISPDAHNEPKDRTQLYDLLKDPHENHDLASVQPERVKALQAHLDAWWNPAAN